MQRFFPFLQWLPNYKKNYFPKDLVAGLTVGILLIPQGMAYAMIAGLPPVYGLYASVFPLVIYAFLGTSKQLAIGPVAMDSLLVAAGLGALAITSEENYIALAILLAFMVGAVQLLLGLLRMGFLVNFLSKPVISGFTSGAAIIIIFSQLKHLLGVQVEKSSKLHEILINISEKISATNPYDLLIGIIGILTIVIINKWSKRIPAILLVVVIGILAVYLLRLQELGVEIVGGVPHGLPAFALPEGSFRNFTDLLPIALTVALVGFMEAISIGKSIEEKNDEDAIDANQELVALGTSNMVGSFFQSFPVTASFSRSAINNETGARSNLASLFSVLLVVITLLFLTPLFYYLPKSVLAAIIVVSVFGLIDVAYPKMLWRYRKDEFVVLLVTFLVTLLVGITEGIVLGVLLSLLLMVYRSSKPHFAVLGRIKGSEYYRNVDRFGKDIEERDDLLILRFDSQLYFGNKNYFKKQLFKYIDAKGSTLKAVILNAEPINYIDSTAVEMLTQAIREIHERDIKFFIASAVGPARDIIFNSRIIEELPKEYLFVRTKEAVDFFDNRESASALQERVAYQNITKGN